MDADIKRVEPIPGAPALIRPGQLLTDAAGAAAVARWTTAVSEADGIFRVRLSPGVDVCDLATTVRDQGNLASPNHILVGQPLFFGGPASRPFPATPPPAPKAPEAPESTVTVAIPDTGLTAHPWWQERPWWRDQRREAAEPPDSDGDGRLDAQAGHGTFIAGLVLRSAPGVRVRPLRVLNSHGIGDEAGVLRALARLRNDPPQVLNLSFGGHTFDDHPSPLMEAALRELTDTAVVACAGNTASDRPFWPAALPEVIAVGALDASEETRAPFSAHGPWVNACARGEWLTSSFIEYEAFRGYACWSGTSFAAAVVSGAIAAAAGSRTPKEAAAHILDPARTRQIPDLGAVVAAPR
ncbi:subtilisin family serine protease [Streptosporangium album]|uniref:Subtilisin family serine protease n=1 Tax=Streptosporangium album TaxID=47479 RepID=A0A7W7W6X4_9ACTN|nr:S8/S53 family peptidase [Streptosporangium album]MBB4936211.1 subtilisin family serine protease [Streptosporangium album]